MLIPVWPGLNFWYILGVISSPSWFFSLLSMDFFKKTNGFVFTFLILTLVLLWSAGNFVVSKLYFSLRRNPNTGRFFRGYQRAGKTFGYALLYFGNLGLYYFSEKSVASILTFLFLALYCLCTFFCIQPYTDFGTIEFLLSARQLLPITSKKEELVMRSEELLHLGPVHPLGSEATSHEDQLDSGQLLPITSKKEELVMRSEELLHPGPVHPLGSEATSHEDQLDSGQLLPITSKKEDPPPSSSIDYGVGILSSTLGFAEPDANGSNGHLLSNGSSISSSRSSGHNRQVQSETTNRNGSRMKEGDPRNDNARIEQYEPGVYITLVYYLPSGAKEIKRVRFSRKRFSKKQAEQWLAENRARLYERYNVEIPFHQKKEKNGTMLADRSSISSSRSSGHNGQVQSETTNRNGSRMKEGDPRNDNARIEQYEHGVYITLVYYLPSGAKDIKRVRFSRKRFSKKQAEQWLAENRARLYERYNVEIPFHQKKEKNGTTLADRSSISSSRSSGHNGQVQSETTNRNGSRMKEGDPRNDNARIEQYEPGVYITLVYYLPSGAKEIKRVRFS
ncbi:hypothetical protein RHGRI_002239 [Rhododendron griersonianum]|uniref:BRX domain-containing protein n=1 Tax=Rhododendron griersonianum TaxID=479676 RepID=A0AAV6LQF3_9ERIC|nr:hypothetical protein RHGRI_002239 [Rhododendron griersonianum]